MASRILVVGGGVAGPVVAYWLSKAGYQVTVIERSKTPTYTGQGIDITGVALEIVQKMGLEQEIRSSTTDETGFAIVGDDATTLAALGTAGTTEQTGATLTQEIEIMRGTLANILSNAAKNNGNVTFRYDCMISDLRQTEDTVAVTLTDKDETEHFAMVVGADGLRSKVRRSIFDQQTLDECYKPRDMYGAFFSMPSEEGDMPESRFQHAPGGRAILIRPINKDRSSCYIMHTAASDKLQDVLSGSMDDKKAAMADAFADFTGLGTRAVREMKASEDFYFERIAQIKLKDWYAGRCVLVGDAAYAPSPLTGQGTTLAILGAYVLAGEIASHAQAPDPTTGFAAYQARLHDRIDKTQHIPLGGNAPRLLNPMTGSGIWALRKAFEFVSWSGVWKVADAFGSGMGKDKFVLPEYGCFNGA